jgi:DNA polymerase III sliding clamp (beta) subunit (PCNA family)
MEISAGDTGIQLGGQPPMIEVSQHAFRRALKWVLPAVDERNARVVLTGVWFGLQGGTLTLCGSDGFRMHLDQSISIADAHEFSMLIPAAALKSLLATLPSNDLPIYLGGNEHQMLICCGAHSVTLNLIPYRYPDIQNVVRQANGETQIIINRKALIRALRYCLPFIKRGEYPTTAIIFYRPTASDSTACLVRVRKDDGGFYGTEVPVQSNISPGIKNYLLINARYLLDALRSLPDNQIECWMNFAPESLPGTDIMIGLNQSMIRLIGHTSKLKYQAFIMPIWFDMKRLHRLIDLG